VVLAAPVSAGAEVAVAQVVAAMAADRDSAWAADWASVLASDRAQGPASARVTALLVLKEPLGSASAFQFRHTLRRTQARARGQLRRFVSARICTHGQ
jgi:hypothetical protein